MKKILGIIAILTVLILPTVTTHAKEFDYQPLEPTFFNKPSNSTDTVSPSTIFETLYNVAIWAAVVLAVFMIVVAGVEYTAGGISESAKSDAKHRIQNALIGLFLALFAYLFLKTLNPQLVGTTLDVGGGTITRGTGTSGGSSGVESGVTQTTSGEFGFVGYFGGDYIFPGVQRFPTKEQCESAVTANAVKLSSGSYCSDKLASWYEIDKLVRNNLSQKNVSVNHSNSCVNPSSGDARNYSGGGCTDVAGLPNKTINELGKLKTDCNCTVEITGGTEPGHATHGRGKNIVDLDMAITSFLRTNGQVQSGSWNGNNPSICMTVKYGLGIFRYEPAGSSPCSSSSTAPHWHVVFSY